MPPCHKHRIYICHWYKYTNTCLVPASPANRWFSRAPVESSSSNVGCRWHFVIRRRGRRTLLRVVLACCRPGGCRRSSPLFVDMRRSSRSSGSRGHRLRPRHRLTGRGTAISLVCKHEAVAALVQGAIPRVPRKQQEKHGKRGSEDHSCHRHTEGGSQLALHGVAKRCFFHWKTT